MKQLTLIGSIGQDATIKEFNGFTSLNFSIAVNEKLKDKEVTNWFTCNLYRRKEHLEQLKSWFKKGSKVYIQGDFNARIYQEKIYTDVSVQQFKLL